MVQESIFDKFISKIKERMTHLRVGDSLDKGIDVGALVDESQSKTIEYFVQTARDEGAEVGEGFYVTPILICPETGLSLWL